MTGVRLSVEGTVSSPKERVACLVAREVRVEVSGPGLDSISPHVNKMAVKHTKSLIPQM